jgi:hypothetical protein
METTDTQPKERDLHDRIILVVTVVGAIIALCAFRADIVSDLDNQRQR